MERAGIKEADTVTAAIQECLDLGYFIQHQAGDDETTASSKYAYSLNTEFELTAVVEQKDVTEFQSPESQAAFQILVEFGREMGADPDLVLARAAVTRNDAAAVKAWIETGREMTHLQKPARFETVLQRLLDQVPPLPIGVFALDFQDDLDDDRDEPKPPVSDAATGQELWQATLKTIKGKVRKSKFRYLEPTQALEMTANALTVAVPNKRTKEWLEEGQLADLVQQTLDSVAGKPIELLFVVNN
jgi:hypothetical protein